MDKGTLKKILQELHKGKLSVEEALDRLRAFPFQDMGFAKIDTHRHLRKGFPEVVLAQEKSAEQIVRIVGQVKETGNNVLITRVDPRRRRQSCEDIRI